jgi:uncharacterized protein
MKKVLVLISLLIFVGLAVIHIYLQDRFIFQAQKLEPSYPYNFSITFEEHFIEVDPGILVNALWFKSDSISKGLVIYFHGNAGSLDRWGELAPDFIERGYELLIFDYRGYGKSEGYPTEAFLYKDASTLYTWANDRTTSTNIVIYGRSLGASIAAHLAVKVQPELLILETPFHELRGAVSTFLYPVLAVFPLNYRFPTIEFLQKVNSKVVIFHGTDDFIVPLRSANKLKGVMKTGDEFILVDEATHNNIRSFTVYKEKLSELLD